MSTGSMRSCPPGGSVTSVTFAIPTHGWNHPRALTACGSDVQEPDVLRVAGDERAARLDVLAHQHAEQLVGLGRVVERDLEQDPLRWAHRGFPQFLGVHLAQALETLHGVPWPRVLATLGDPGLDLPVALGVAVGVAGLGATALPLDLVERRLRE